MINYKNFIRAFGILLFTALFLISCASKNDEDFPFVTIGDEDSAEEREFSKYNIVISHSASGALIDSARELCEKIEAKTGVDTGLYYDDEPSGASESACVIYVGNVNEKDFIDVLMQMRSEDYICRAYDNKILLGGKCDTATMNAVERFTNEILPVSDPYRFIPEDGGFEHKGDYNVTGLYIDNVSLCDYDIVVNSIQDTAATDSAYALQSRISESFGYWLNVRIGEGSATGRNIYIRTDRSCIEGRGELENTGNNIVIKAADRTGIAKSVDKFFELLCSDGLEGELHPNIPKMLYSAYGTTECTVAFAELNFIPELSSPLICTEFRTEVLDRSPDVLLFGNADESDSIMLKESFTNYQNMGGEDVCAFAAKDMTATLLSENEYGGASCQTFSVRAGELDFILVYVSGSVEDKTTIDIAGIVGESGLPVVAISLTEVGGDLQLLHSQQPFFGSVVEKSIGLYGKDVSYKCYTDASRLSVSEAEWNNKFGLAAINLSIAQ